jgi:hypothetical protein
MREKRQRPLNYIASFVSVLLATAAAAAATERPVVMVEIPPAVRKTIIEQRKGATVRALSEELEHGHKIYEAKLEVNGHRRDISINERGAIVEVEEEVSIDALPAKAKVAIEEEIGSGKLRLLRLESVKQANSPDKYEALVQKASTGKKFEIRVNGEGLPVPEK